jgi:hypothetical protein
MDPRGLEFWERMIALLPTEEELAARSGRFQPMPLTFDEEAGIVRGPRDWVGAF